MKRRLSGAAAALVAALLASSAGRGGGVRGADAPRLDAVDPGRGAVESATEVRLTGDGFEPGSGLLLLIMHCKEYNIHRPDVSLYVFFSELAIRLKSGWDDKRP